MSSRISNSRKIPGPKKRELGGHTVVFSKQHAEFLTIFIDQKWKLDIQIIYFPKKTMSGLPCLQQLSAKTILY